MGVLAAPTMKTSCLTDIEVEKQRLLPVKRAMRPLCILDFYFSA